MSALPDTAGRGPAPRTAIVDFRLGNLFSVERACAVAGLSASITSERRAIETADVVILPGVGAFGDAMANLRALDLVEALIDVPASGRLLIGVCLGVQLLMRESEEFGAHAGLGPDRRLGAAGSRRRRPRAKVPQVGWNRDPRAAGRRVGADAVGGPDARRLHVFRPFLLRRSGG